ncbi:MAG: hypothetical protein IAE95_11780 [Chitinophagaceae bacterium]|nr:hypothetical protein [Chitinophagaceae bacterium]
MDFTVNIKKAKHLYEVTNNQTSVDRFVVRLKKEFGDTFHAISVDGLSAGRKNFGFKQLPYGFEQRALYWEAKNFDATRVREYYLKLYVNRNRFPLKICNLEWVGKYNSSFEQASENSFYYNRNAAFRLIESFFKKHTKFFMVSVFCGYLPQSSWPSRCYIKVVIKLPVTAIDVFEQCSIDNLTDFGTTFRNEIKEEFCKLVDSGGYDLSKLFIEKNERKTVIRIAENLVRKRKGLKNVGDSFVNETLLANFTKALFPDTVRQYNPRWLGKYSIDIFIPALKIALEYHGEQHYVPIDRFGGEEKLLKQQERDAFVRRKCQEYSVKLIEWPYTKQVTQQAVYELLSENVVIKNYAKPLTLFD